MNTIFPHHNASVYTVQEHDLTTCPPDLWPMIQAWLERQAAV